MNTLRFEAVGCPLCGSQDRSPWAKRVVEGYEVCLVHCGQCTLVYANPRLTADAAASLFDSSRYFAGGEENLAYRDYLAGERYLVATARDRLSRIGRRVPGGRMLEVGSAAGFFLAEARRLGFETIGIERSPSMCEHARQHFGARVYAGDFLEVSEDPEHFAAGRFDAIAAFGVTSLLREPREALARMARLLRPGGVLAFNVFLTDSFHARVARSRWWILTPAMSQVWNSDLLTRTLDELGMEVVCRRREMPSTDLEKVLGYLGIPTAIAVAKRLRLANRVFRLPLPDCSEWIAVRR